MQRFIANRIGQSIFTLWALATVVFFSVDLTGDPALFLLPADAPPGELERLRHSLGLDRPIHVRYGIFLTMTHQRYIRFRHHLVTRDVSQLAEHLQQGNRCPRCNVIRLPDFTLLD